MQPFVSEPDSGNVTWTSDACNTMPYHCKLEQMRTYCDTFDGPEDFYLSQEADHVTTLLPYDVCAAADTKAVELWIGVSNRVDDRRHPAYIGVFDISCLNETTKKSSSTAAFIGVHT